MTIAELIAHLCTFPSDAVFTVEGDETYHVTAEAIHSPEPGVVSLDLTGEGCTVAE